MTRNLLQKYPSVIPAKAGIQVSCTFLDPRLRGGNVFSSFARGSRSMATALLLLVLSLSGCISAPEVIEDIRTLPQDNTYYLDAASANREAVSPEALQEMHKNFLNHFFQPWYQSAPSHTRDTLALEFTKYSNRPAYGENGRERSKEWFDELARNAALETYPSANFKAITLDNSDLRLLPTHRPHFSSLRADGTGYPFDNFQNSAIPAGTPIYVAQVARDKSWLFVDSHYGSGWLPARDVATVDPEFRAAWEHSDFVAIARDNLPVYDESGTFLFKTNLGAQFPRVDQDDERYVILVAQEGEHRTARIERTVIPRDSAVLQPLRLTQANIAVMANELINKPYGWGGLYQNRDCSSTLKDLFSPFGVWLPRHSSHQALKAGRFMDLSSLAPEDREAMILKHGIPFLTLIWVRGHIMLYIGNQQGRAVVFHNMWGVKTSDWLGRQERNVVGHAAITTLLPGAELANPDSPGRGLLNRIEGMTLLVGETR
jgi:hypothetical protein